MVLTEILLKAWENTSLLLGDTRISFSGEKIVQQHSLSVVKVIIPFRRIFGF